MFADSAFLKSEFTRLRLEAKEVLKKLVTGQGGVMNSVTGLLHDIEFDQYPLPGLWMEIKVSWLFELKVQEVLRKALLHRCESDLDHIDAALGQLDAEVSRLAGSAAGPSHVHRGLEREVVSTLVDDWSEFRAKYSGEMPRGRALLVLTNLRSLVFTAGVAVVGLISAQTASDQATRSAIRVAVATTVVLVSGLQLAMTMRRNAAQRRELKVARQAVLKAADERVKGAAAEWEQLLDRYLRGEEQRYNAFLTAAQGPLKTSPGLGAKPPAEAARLGTEAFERWKELSRKRNPPEQS
jgi:hypothetical protein